ncbi:MAG: transcription antitermination factor NusB [Acidimicrobiia bacterium]|nr:transcription antitermination factor NusB [Acidimicrobiia bacterium]
MTRPEAREEALAALYAAEATAGPPDIDGLSARGARLVTAVWQRRADLDAAIAARAHGWRVERMPTVDRTILRIGAYELLETDLPVGIAVSEAVELAKRYSTARSGAFVNGVLGTMAREAAETRPTT